MTQEIEILQFLHYNPETSRAEIGYALTNAPSQHSNVLSPTVSQKATLRLSVEVIKLRAIGSLRKLMLLWS